METRANAANEDLATCGGATENCTVAALAGLPTLAGRGDAATAQGDGDAERALDGDACNAGENDWYVTCEGVGNKCRRRGDCAVAKSGVDAPLIGRC